MSLTDTTAILYAVKIGAQLSTGDMSMRRQAEERGVVVRGIIYVFDELVRCGIMTKPEAAAKLVELTKKNKRLPKGECDRRIAEWKN